MEQNVEAPVLRLPLQSDIERLQSDFWDPSESYYTWGCEELDAMLPLLGRNQLVVLAGAQSSGKTTWTIEMALKNALLGRDRGFRVGYLSLEVKPENILRRRAERAVHIDKETRRKGLMFDLEDVEMKKQRTLAVFQSFLDSGLMFWQEGDLRHLDDIERICLEESGPNLLFIDNLSEILSSEKDEYERTDRILRVLSDLKNSTDTTFVLLHHLAKTKSHEPLGIESIKGNNITITKADTTVAIDKHHAPNFNWRCQPKDGRGKLVSKGEYTKFLSYAPQIMVRSVYCWKDRYYGNEGRMGFMQLTEDGELEFLSREQMAVRYPLMEPQRLLLQAALEKHNLVAADAEDEVLNAEFLPF